MHVDRRVANGHAHVPMRRISTALLLLCFLGLGSGALRFAHDAAHAQADARLESAARSAGLPTPTPDR